MFSPLRITILLTLLVASSLVGWILLKPDPDIRAAEQAAERRDFEEASRHIDRLLQRDSQDAEARILAARIARRGGDLAAARAHLRLCEPRGDRRTALKLDIENRLLEAQLGDLRQIERLAKEHAERGPSEAALMLEATALGCLQVLSPTPGASTILAPHQVEIHRMGMVAAEGWLLLRPQPADQAAGLVWRGRLNDIAGDHAAAMRDLNLARTLQPDAFDVQFALALSSRIEAAPHESLETLLRLAARRPYDPQLRRLIAGAHRRLGQLDEAAAILDEQLKHEPDNASLLLERGQVAVDRVRGAEAEPFLSRARELAPEAAEVYIALSRCMQLLGRAEKVKEYLDKYQQLDAARRPSSN